MVGRGRGGRGGRDMIGLALGKVTGSIGVEYG